VEISEILSAPVVKLKPNIYLKDPSYLFGYQSRAVLMLLKQPRMVLGDAVGLGKTITSLACYSYLKSKDPTLKAIVFTEKSVLFQWKKCIDELLSPMRAEIITASSHPNISLRDQLYRKGGYDVLITTYGSVYRYVGGSELSPLEVGLGDNFIVIADEASAFKGVSNKLNKRLGVLAGRAKRVYGLTATVIENSLDEVYGIMKVVNPSVFPSRANFEREFCIYKKFKVRGIHLKKLVSYKNVKEFVRRMGTVYYGRLQSDPEVQQDLPEEVTKDVVLEMSVEQSRKVQEAIDGIVITGEGSVVRIQKIAALTLCQQLVNSPELKGFNNVPSVKEEALLEMLTNSLLGQKIAIFTKYRSQIDRLEALLIKEKIRSVRITGAEDISKRNYAQVLFNDPKSGIDILFLNRAGAKGLNLQGGQHLIFFDLPWSGGLYTQIVGRLKRTGSSYNFVCVYRFIAKMHTSLGGDSTIDGYVLDTLTRKMSLISQVQGQTSDFVSVDSSLDEIFARCVTKKV